LPDIRQTALFPNLKRAKTSFSLSPEAKFQLARLKADLRREGYRATESSIVESLIATANVDESVLPALKRAHATTPPRGKAD
jgi:hypothetical protein